MTGKQTSPERPTPKSPIYSCEVIQTACRALEAIAVTVAPGDLGLDAATIALRIIHDGLLGQERAIKGETT